MSASEPRFSFPPGPSPAPGEPEGWFRLIVEAAPNAMMMVDSARTIILVNRGAELLFGYSREELVGREIEMLIPPRFRDGHPAHFAGFLREPRTRAMGAGRELFGLRKDGTEVPIEIGLNPIDTSRGLHTLASIIDITERKRAEDRFRLVVEAAPTAMLVADRERVITLVNGKAEELFGYPREELVGQPIETLVPARFRSQHPHHIESFFAAPRARAMGAGRDLYGLRRDGSEFPVEIGLNPIDTPDGALVMTSIIDITERKRIEKAARDSEERFRLMVEGVTDYAFLMLDERGHVASWNAAAERMKGYTADEIVGRHCSCFYTPADVALGRPEKELEAAAAAGRFEGEGWHVRKDGRRFWANVVITAMRDENGVFCGFSRMTHDLTLRRQMEEKFQLVVEASPTGMVMVDGDGVLLLVNVQIERLFGYSRGELLGQPIELLVPERFRAGHPAHRTSFFAAPVSRAMGVGRDLFGRRKDGSEFPVEIGLNPIETSDGRLVMASIIDITERKRTEDELRRSNAELEQFAYIASHDLQEPLRMVASYTELLGQRYQGKLDEKADKYIHYAVDGAKRMQSLVADLLAYSRVGSQGKPLVAVPSALILQRVLQILGVQIRSAGAVVEVGSLPVVLADEGQLRQLFQNLVGNAIKFRRDVPPRVRVDARRDGSSWLFSVEDNGVGIEMQYAERIFQMFQRLHARGAYEGSGIGLTIAKRIVERHGGRIWLESEPGRGTTFFFTLLPASPSKGLS